VFKCVLLACPVVASYDHRIAPGLVLGWDRAGSCAWAVGLRPLCFFVVRSGIASLG